MAARLANVPILASLLLGLPVGLYGLYYVQNSLGHWQEFGGGVPPSRHSRPASLSGGSSSASTPHNFQIHPTQYTWSCCQLGVPQRIRRRARHHVVEGSRRGFANTPLAWIGVWGLLANAFGISLASFRLCGCRVSFSTIYEKERHEYPCRTAHGALLSLIAGYTIPTFAMLLFSFYRPDSYQEEVIIALWQFCPLWLHPLCLLFTRVIQTSSSPTVSGLDDETLARLRLVQGRQATEQLYLFQGVLNLIIYAATFVHTQFQGLQLKDALLMLATKDTPVGLSFEEIGGFLCSHLLLADFAVMNIGIILWVILQDGLLHGLAVLLGFVLIGPGAAIAFYAARREHRIQEAQDVTKKTQ